MKAFINSIVFASLAACTVIPAQAGVMDWIKEKATAMKKTAIQTKAAIQSQYENAKNSITQKCNSISKEDIVAAKLILGGSLLAYGALKLQYKEDLPHQLRHAYNVLLRDVFTYPPFTQLKHEIFRFMNFSWCRKEYYKLLPMFSALITGTMLTAKGLSSLIKNHTYSCYYTNCE